MADKTIWRPWHLMEQTRHGDRSQWTEIEVWDDDNDVIVATEVRRAHNDGGRKRMELIAAAGTAASEVADMGYDPVEAVRALPELLRRATLMRNDVRDMLACRDGCGDPDIECPMQDSGKPGSTEDCEKALSAALTRAARKEGDDDGR